MILTVLNYGYLRMMNTTADEVIAITPTNPPDTKPTVNDASELFAGLKKITEKVWNMKEFGGHNRYVYDFNLHYILEKNNSSCSFSAWHLSANQWSRLFTVYIKWQFFYPKSQPQVELVFIRQSYLLIFDYQIFCIIPLVYIYHEGSGNYFYAKRCKWIFTISLVYGVILYLTKLEFPSLVQWFWKKDDLISSIYFFSILYDLPSKKKCGTSFSKT